MTHNNLVAPQVQEVSAKINNQNVPVKQTPQRRDEIVENDKGVSERNKHASDVERADRSEGDTGEGKFIGW